MNTSGKILVYTFITLLALVATITYGNSEGKIPSAEAKQKPNIIWLMAEDISLDLGCYGTPAVKTPVLDRLANEGVMYTNCFTTNSICSPSRSAMMTGVHQDLINAGNHRSNRNVPLPERIKPFTYWLRKEGYTCILGSKHVYTKGRKIDCNFKTKAVGPYDGIKEFGLFDKVDDFTTEDQPFFAQIQLKRTHRGDWWQETRDQSEHPVNPDSVKLPPYFANDPVIRMDWAKYLDQMEYIDNEVSFILGDLEEKGMIDNTVIIFIGDNGRCNIRGKGYLHDPGLHVPLIVWWPSGIKGGQIDDRMISATDITAAILDLAGIERPDYMTGRSFLDKDFERDAVYGSRDLWDEISDSSRTVITTDYQYIANYKPATPFDAGQAYLEFYRPAVHVMRRLKAEGRLKGPENLFFVNRKPSEELYDRKKDPHQLRNLAEDPAFSVLCEKLKKELLELQQRMTPSEYICKPVEPGSVEVLDWVKSEKPGLYKEMLNGVEIGFQTLTQEYSSQTEKTQKKK